MLYTAPQMFKLFIAFCVYMQVAHFSSSIKSSSRAGIVFYFMIRHTFGAWEERGKHEKIWNAEVA